MGSQKIYKRIFESLRNFSLRTFLNDLAEAVSGTEQDFTEVRIRRAIFMLAIPAVLEMIMESVFVIVEFISYQGLAPKRLQLSG